MNHPFLDRIRNIRQHLPCDLVVIDTTPKDVHIEPAPPSRTGQDVIVDIPGLPVGLLNLVTHTLSFLGEPRPGAVHPLAVGIVLGTIKGAEPFLFRQLHHQGHQAPEDEGQYQQPQVAGE